MTQLAVLASPKQIGLLNDLLYQTGNCVANKSTGEVTFPRTIADTGEVNSVFPFVNSTLSGDQASKLINHYRRVLESQVSDGNTLTATSDRIARAVSMATILNEKIDAAKLENEPRTVITKLLYVLSAKLNEARQSAKAEMGLDDFVPAS